MTLNIYRSVLEWIKVDSTREMRVRLSDIENVKIYDNMLLKLETYNKIDLNILPKTLEDAKLFVEKLSENCKSFLGYDINIEFLPLSEFVKNPSIPKS